MHAEKNGWDNVHLPVSPYMPPVEYGDKNLLSPWGKRGDDNILEPWEKQGDKNLFSPWGGIKIKYACLCSLDGSIFFVIFVAIRT